MNTFRPSGAQHPSGWTVLPGSTPSGSRASSENETVPDSSQADDMVDEIEETPSPLPVTNRKRKGPSAADKPLSNYSKRSRVSDADPPQRTSGSGASPVAGPSQYREDPGVSQSRSPNTARRPFLRRKDSSTSQSIIRSDSSGSSTRQRTPPIARKSVAGRGGPFGRRPRGTFFTTRRRPISPPTAIPPGVVKKKKPLAPLRDLSSSSDDDDVSPPVPGLKQAKRINASRASGRRLTTGSIVADIINLISDEEPDSSNVTSKVSSSAGPSGAQRRHTMMLDNELGKSKDTPITISDSEEEIEVDAPCLPSEIPSSPLVASPEPIPEDMQNLYDDDLPPMDEDLPQSGSMSKPVSIASASTDPILPALDGMSLESSPLESEVVPRSAKPRLQLKRVDRSGKFKMKGTLFGGSFFPHRSNKTVPTAPEVVKSLANSTELDLQGVGDESLSPKLASSASCLLNIQHTPPHANDPSEVYEKEAPTSLTRSESKPPIANTSAVQSTSSISSSDPAKESLRLQSGPTSSALGSPQLEGSKSPVKSLASASSIPQQHAEAAIESLSDVINRAYMDTARKVVDLTLSDNEAASPPRSPLEPPRSLEDMKRPATARWSSSPTTSRGKTLNAPPSSPLEPDNRMSEENEVSTMIARPPVAGQSDSEMEEDVQPRRLRRSTRRSRRILSRERSKQSSQYDSRSTSADPLDVLPRRRQPISRSSSGTSEEFAKSLAGLNITGMTHFSWRRNGQYVAKEFADMTKLAEDLPHELEDRLNALPFAARSAADMQRKLFAAIISINTAKEEPNAPPISIVNEIDREPTPAYEFHYTNLMWHSPKAPRPDFDALKGCDCVGLCNPRSCACAKRQREYLDDPELRSYGFLYDKDGRLVVHQYPIFECNVFCGCDDFLCQNRVVQKGRNVSLQIKKTPKKGWGIFAGQDVPANSFIGIYSGEFLTDKEAQERGKKYNQFGRTYLFDLDFWYLKTNNKRWKPKFCIDAYHAGNFTRYLNHSCDPNCVINPCYINEANIEKPLLTIFTCRDVAKGEELCFSYFGEMTAEELNENIENDAIYAPCQCEAKNCTGRMWK
ncbi:unnamed protein product [Somion occarium]|uniref:SET domain-containing protein n=1 Tax=Somion occarium TaxID=3059160 RepID=A0ABP1DIA4_9APHY